ncbi:response regulator, partial [bacterium]|nr:response regulator [bacterium]
LEDRVEERTRKLSESLDTQNILNDKLLNSTLKLNDSYKKAEELRQIAEVANQAKSEFLANMSHEIRTPMNAVLGYAEILKSKIKDPRLSQYVQSIYSSGKSLLGLINDILDLSKVEAGKLELEYTAVSTRTLFIEMQTVFEQKMAHKELELVIDIPPELPKALLLDKARLRQILINLIGNAIKFTDSGFIKLSLNCRYPDDIQQNTVDIVFSIEDSGRGIPKDHLDSIFNAFTQIKGQKTSQFGGTGLGLTISSRLIKLMNGEITVISKVGQGSTFSIVLKDVKIASDEALVSQQHSEIDFASLRFEKGTILIADDIEFNRELLKEFLYEFDFTLIEAKNGIETIELARQYHPRLILLDIKMPEMDGYEAAKIMKDDRNLKGIPLIAVTASAMKKDEEKIKSVCDSYLTKPISKTDLISRLMRFLPHTITKKEPAEFFETAVKVTLEKLSREQKAQLPELLGVLENETTRNWNQIGETFDFVQIKEFAESVKILGIKYNLTILTEWSQNLIQQAESYNMAKLPDTLRIFPKLVENIANAG